MTKGREGFVILAFGLSHSLVIGGSFVILHKGHEMLPDNGDPDRDPVDVLAEEFADRLRRGEHPSVSDYAAQHPEHADQLRELLPAVAQMEYLKRFRRSSGAAEKEELPDRFGDFRILRELGRGGMGVVFEAVQESLGRPVALKVLATHAQLDPTRRERFVREAQAAAKLHHTNIVPVFGVGEQDGIPYYVMQLIRGDGLNAVAARWRLARSQSEKETGVRGQGTVQETGVRGQESEQAVSRDPEGSAPPTHLGGALPSGSRLTGSLAHDPCPLSPEGGPSYSDWSFVAEVGLQAADALHYAHKQGVLHRDVKPANLILDPAGRVWVADFGLAKLVNLHGLTATGDILGTLQYLAPECLAGDSDPRSDVYGLGATLYELLTLQPPYPTESPARLVKQVADADPPAPRQLNPAIPRDLETIVMKAMAREPHRRYAGARELAADLQAFLEDRPITARRETALGRAWRWCRRNPATAITGANAVAALVLAGVVGWVGYVNTRQALDAEEVRRKEAEEARADAVKARNDAVLASDKLEANLKLSLEAFEKVFEAAAGTRQGFGVGPWVRPFPPGPGGPGPGGRPGGPGGGGGGGVGLIFVPGPGPGPPPGPIPIGPFGSEAADKAAVLEAILAFYDKFAEQNATNQRLQLEAAKARRRVGEAQFWLGQAEKAAASFRRAAALLDDLRARYPADESVRVELVQTYLYAPADVFGTDAEAVLHRVLELARTLEGGPRAHLAGSVWLRLGWVREQAKDAAGAEAAYRAAVAGLTAPKGDDVRPPVVFEQSFARDRLATLLANTDRLPEARQVLKKSVSELKRLPPVPGPGGPGGPPGTPREFLLVATYHKLADVCEKLGDRDDAEDAREEATRIERTFGPKKEPPRKK
jgi:serine/threonine protein kinase